MKKAILLVFSFYLLVSFAACDKIEDDQHWVYSGVTAEWQDCKGDIPDIPRVMIEKYTGVRCVNCPKADTVLHEAMEKYPAQFIVVAVHAGVFSRPYGNDPSLSCPVAEEWHDYFGITAEPAGILMREKTSSGDWNIFTPIENFDNRIDEYLNTSREMALRAVRYDTGGYSYANIQIEFLKDVTEPLTLTVIAIEDNVKVTQESPNGHVEDYPENHVLRCAITDPWGMDVVADGKKGTKRQVTIPIELTNVSNKNSCCIVAFISEKESRRILNVDSFYL